MSDGGSRATAVERVRAALDEMEAALRAFEKAYLEWVQADHLQKPLRKGLLTQAEMRLMAARDALAELEARLAEARSLEL